MNGSRLYNSGDRYGFLYNTEDKTYMLEIGSKNSGGIRCIRDVVE